MSDSSDPVGLPGRLPSSPPCPFCDSTESEVHSLFGSHASVTTYWCRSCRSPFEHMRWGRRFDPRSTELAEEPEEDGQ